MRWTASHSVHQPMNSSKLIEPSPSRVGELERQQAFVFGQVLVERVQQRREFRD